MSPYNKLDGYIVEHLSHLLPKVEEDGSRIIYHYTTIEALSTMTQRNSDFLCTYCSAMNDRAELYTGLNVLKKYITKYPASVESLPMSTIRDFAFRPQYAPWSLSFSTHGDSLNQWISYTDRYDGGVAIGFDIKQIYDLINRRKSSTEIMFLAPCLYEVSHEKEIDELFGFLFGAYKEHIVSIGCIDNGRVSEGQVKRFTSLLMAFIFASIVKDESFSLENEWRLVIHPLEETRTRNYIDVGGKPRLVTNLFGGDFMLADSIKRIVCSPHGRSYDKVAIIASLRQLHAALEKSRSTYTTTH